MTIFLFVSLISFLIFMVFAFLRPIGPPPSLHTPVPVPRAIFNTILLLLVTIAVLLIFLTISMSMHPPYGTRLFVPELLFGRQFGSALLGITFGILFGVFVHQVLTGPPDQTLTTSGKVMLGSMVALFIIGLGAGPFLDSATRRLTKISFGGAEVELASADDFDTRRQQAAPLRSDNGRGTGNLRRNGDLGLIIVFWLPEFIERDCKYLKYLYLSGKYKGEYFVDKIDSNRCLSNSNEKSLTKEENASLKRLLQARDIVARLASPLAQCLRAELYYSWDDGFADERLKPILVKLQGIRARGRATKAEIEALADTYQRQSSIVLDRVRLRIGAGNERLFGAECDRLIYMLCSTDDWDRKKEIAGTLKIDEARTKPQSVVLQQDLAAKVSATAKELFKQGPDTCDAPAKDFNKRVRAELSAWLRFDSTPNRPYLTMVTAALMSHLRRSDAAIKALHDWQRLKRASGQSASEHHQITARIRNLTTIILQSTTGGQENRMPTLLRSFFIDQLEDYIEFWETKFKFNSAFRKERHANSVSSLDENGFSRLPNETSCGVRARAAEAEADKKDNLRQFLTQDEFEKIFDSYASSLGALAHHMMLHTFYERKYMPIVRRLVEDLLMTNLGCAPQARRKYLRAQFLGLYAYMQYKEAYALSRIRKPSVTEANINSGLRAVELGLRLVSQEARHDIDDREKKMANQDLTKSLEVTPAISSFDSLVHIQNRLSRAAKDLAGG